MDDLSLRIVFMGTPDFSVDILSALIEAGHEIVCVYSQPPRKAGRGHKERPTPVHAFAAQNHIEVRTPLSLKPAEEQQAFAALNTDIAVVAAYGLILPRAILEAPRLGCLNVHASILPRWRGAAPIQRAIEAGDDVSGVTIMQMDEGLDTGDMLLIEPVAITETTTGESLHDALASTGARLIVEAVRGCHGGYLKAKPQPADGVTYARKLEKNEGKLDFTQSAAVLERLVRAFYPWPGTWVEHQGERLKVLACQQCKGTASATPGQRLDAPGLTIACGDNSALRLTQVQRAGKGPMEDEALLRGYTIAVGDSLS